MHQATTGHYGQLFLWSKIPLRGIFSLPISALQHDCPTPTRDEEGIQPIFIEYFFKNRKIIKINR